MRKMGGGSREMFYVVDWGNGCSATIKSTRQEPLLDDDSVGRNVTSRHGRFSLLKNGQSTLEIYNIEDE